MAPKITPKSIPEGPQSLQNRSLRGSWGVLGGSWAALEGVWAAMGVGIRFFRAVLTSILARLGDKLGPRWASGGPGGPLVASNEPQEGVMWHQEASDRRQEGIM